MSSKIYFIRHGITEGNQKRWFYGQADIPLVEEGRKTLEDYVSKGIYPVVLKGDFYTTGLLRTEETFRIIFGDRPHDKLELLKEMDFGDYECKSYEDLKDCREFDTWVYDQTGEVSLPGGESRNQFSKRVSKGLEELINAHIGKDSKENADESKWISAVVCHGGVISAIMAELFPETDKNMWDWIPEPGLGYMVELEARKAVKYREIRAYEP